MARDESNEVKLKRPRGFYISDNELVDELAADIGIFAFGVYHLLLRKAEDKPGARLSRREIAATLGISTDSATNAIATLKKSGLIEEKPTESPNDTPMYLIVFAKDVLAARNGASPVRTKIRTRVVTKRVRKSGQEVPENQDAGARNSGHERTKFRTPNKEVNANPDKSQTPPKPPKGGDELGEGQVLPRSGRERCEALTAEQREELDEVNAIRARMTPPQCPVSTEDYLRYLAQPQAEPRRGTEPPGGRRRRRRFGR